MMPKPRTDFEKVESDVWIPGFIKDIERDEARESEFKGEKRIVDSVRFVFELEGYKFPHKSRWMALSYHKKAGLFSKYMVALVENAKPYMLFDLTKIKNMKVKTMWSQNGEWSNLEMIRPLDKKMVAVFDTPKEQEPPAEEGSSESDDDLPF